MWSSNSYLKRCEKLKEAGLAFELGVGTRIARGFADLGYEEFYCLSGNKLVSVFTGHGSTLNPDHRNFFFSVPDLEFLVNEIVKRKFDIESFLFIDQRIWTLTLLHAETRERIEVKDPEVLCAAAEALLTILKAEVL